MNKGIIAAAVGLLAVSISDRGWCDATPPDEVGLHDTTDSPTTPPTPKYTWGLFQHGYLASDPGCAGSISIYLKDLVPYKVSGFNGVDIVDSIYIMWQYSGKCTTVPFKMKLEKTYFDCSQRTDTIIESYHITWKGKRVTDFIFPQPEPIFPDGTFGDDLYKLICGEQ